MGKKKKEIKDEDIEIMYRFKKCGVTREKIAEIFDLPIGRVTAILSRESYLQQGKRTRGTEVIDDEVNELLQQGKSLNEIPEILESRIKLNPYLRAQKSLKKGERDLKKSLIIHLNGIGITQPTLAELFKMSKQRISQILIRFHKKTGDSLSAKKEGKMFNTRLKILLEHEPGVLEDEVQNLLKQKLTPEEITETLRSIMASKTDLQYKEIEMKKIKHMTLSEKTIEIFANLGIPQLAIAKMFKINPIKICELLKKKKQSFKIDDKEKMVRKNKDFYKKLKIILEQDKKTIQDLIQSMLEQNKSPEEIVYSVVSLVESRDDLQDELDRRVSNEAERIELIKELREAGLTQGTIAGALGVSQPCVSQTLNRQGKPSLRGKLKQADEDFNKRVSQLVLQKGEQLQEIINALLEEGKKATEIVEGLKALVKSRPELKTETDYMKEMRFKKLRNQALEELVDLGISQATLAKMFDISQSRISELLIERGYTTKGNVSINKELNNSIIRMLNKGESSADIIQTVRMQVFGKDTINGEESLAELEAKKQSLQEKKKMSNEILKQYEELLRTQAEQR